MSTATASIEEMSFEQAMQELETIVTKMESGQTPLEDSIISYERGMALKKHCAQKLSDAQAKIEKITMKANGDITTEPFEEKE